MQLTADKCLGVFHISSAAKQVIAKKHQRARFVLEYVSKREKEKKKLARLHHTTSYSLSFIKLSLLFPIFLTHLHTHTHTHTHTPAHRRSGYSGWCYSRCGLVEVSML